MLNKIRIINKEALDEVLSKEEPMIFTLLALPKNPDGYINLLHKTLIASLRSEDEFIMGVTLLFKEGSGMINPAEIPSMNLRIIFHNLDGILIGDMVEPKYIYDTVCEGCKQCDIPAPPPMITPKVESQIIPMPFNPNPKSLKS